MFKDTNHTITHKIEFDTEAIERLSRSVADDLVFVIGVWTVAGLLRGALKR